MESSDYLELIKLTLTKRDHGRVYRVSSRLTERTVEKWYIRCTDTGQLVYVHCEGDMKLVRKLMGILAQADIRYERDRPDGDMIAVYNLTISEPRRPVVVEGH